MCAEIAEMQLHRIISCSGSKALLVSVVMRRSCVELAKVSNHTPHESRFVCWDKSSGGCRRSSVRPVLSSDRTPHKVTQHALSNYVLYIADQSFIFSTEVTFRALMMCSQ
jgi:hypothetical protein